MIAKKDKVRLWFDDENDVTFAIHPDGIECLEILSKVVPEVPFCVRPRNFELLVGEVS
jgi:hypothetical protein